jgi:pyruvate/2-oxoglutarate/acetoin dehydrogenase E1 component
VGSLKKYDLDIVVQSLHRTKKLLLIDWTWKCCNWSANVIKDLYLNYGISDIKVDSFNLPETYAPANFDLESDFFITKQDIFNHILTLHYEN